MCRFQCPLCCKWRPVMGEALKLCRRVLCRAVSEIILANTGVIRALDPGPLQHIDPAIS